MKLNNIIEIKAKLVLKTGLHIGAGDSEMHIGGIDNAVIKHPITHSPYIPGSSFKGKIRALLEWRSGEVKSEPLNLKSLQHAKDPSAVKNILSLFGVTGDSQNDEATLAEIGVSRLAFWDCALNKEWESTITADNLMLTEAKTENMINRISSLAEHPRQTERVPAGAEFDFKLTMRQFEGDSEALLDLLLKGLRLLELDSLGGSGSRGYGKVKFENLTVAGKPVELDAIDPFQ
ncbi:TPA: type III-A CRISPR-associated RAMP protein Csm3 [Pasteurella multocida]|uniref:type III-A CRISPR-associated RAMP protein Csm3 n=1 Tax=Pasteurella multocida TaxID=747 RepID=UPI00061A6D94|nr:type III-A CRISPR-associated RAMP protein Csm3 [Pasteurella multocida]AKD39563.1 CRISPR-associated RAMP protein, Csm3 family [Pasteurella multocida OH1905]URJ90261.1 type III-A CRISPR-associated RAMP protein Csm3 [Pasteurella multocida]WRK05853.1 type III-A CRISPR-associated RAMP protein Csm3 [Pasteurella multocida]HDR1788551.1 type III-A CRISPR-associated RAMP protein Csm3 [Pasteurella multocida]HED4421078.1 type III-A CRISPR-associated RAMP protein Csm3 [Pasteurella multocida]